MLAPAMSKLSINFVTNESHTCLTCPKSKRFNISAIKHTPGRITWGIDENDARISTVSATLGRRLRKCLRGEAMTITCICLDLDHSPPCKVCHWSIADP